MTEQQPRRRGRPSKFTPDRCALIIAAIRVGNHFDVSCQAAGVSEDTVYEWLRKADQEPDGPFGEFRQEVVKARAEWELRAVASITKAASAGDWKAAVALLERRAPERWGLVHRMEINQQAMTEMTALVMRTLEEVLTAAIPDVSLQYEVVRQLRERFAALEGSPEVRALPPVVR